MSDIITMFSNLPEATEWKVGYTLKESDNYYRIEGFDNTEDSYGWKKVIISPEHRYGSDHIQYRYYSEDRDNGRKPAGIYASSGYALTYIPKRYEEIISDAESMLRGEFDLSPYLEDKRKTTELMSFNKDTYVQYKESLELKRQHLKAVEALCKEMLEARMHEMYVVMKEFNKKIEKLKRIIWTIELYLGIEEDIHQIKHGQPADDTIYLMQQRLYMDEELGDPTDDGLTIDKVEDFDEWLLEKNEYYKMYNYELFVPFEKCVRTLRVRRHEKDRSYIENPFVRSMMAQGDFETYILIRNGENIYRICSKLNFGEKLFPKHDELMKIYERDLESLKNTNYRNGESVQSQEDKEKAAELTVKNTMQSYQRNMIMMQGLVDRTEVFGKMFGLINFLDGSSAEKGDVEFFYEDDKTKLEDGSESPLKWLSRARDYKEGDQILLINNPNKYKSYREGDGSDFYMFKMPWNRKNFPSWPNVKEMYTVYAHHINENEKHLKFYATDTSILYIKYKPEKLWAWDGSKSKQSVSFRLCDSFAVNLNVISHRDMDRMWELMHDRRDRQHYLKTMSAILLIRRYKLAQIEEEKPFAQLIQGLCDLTYEESLDYIHWWKTKNKWKRNLSLDDKKAIRMIQKRVILDNKDNTYTPEL